MIIIYLVLWVCMNVIMYVCDYIECYKGIFLCKIGSYFSIMKVYYIKIERSVGKIYVYLDFVLSFMLLFIIIFCVIG